MMEDPGQRSAALGKLVREGLDDAGTFEET